MNAPENVYGMDLLGVITHHGYAATAILLFLAASGIPVPALVVLIAAGAASHGLGLSLTGMLPLAWAATLAGDMVLFMAGRYSGWWLLAGICRLTLDPERCIFRSADLFYRRGPNTLLYAKFVPGLAAMASPLAGSLNMRPSRFLRFEALGVLGYVTVYILVGFFFSNFVERIIHGLEAAGRVGLALLLTIVIGYCLAALFFSVKASRYNKAKKISAASLNERLKHPDPNRLMVIADVRSHGYYDPGMTRIKNSIRVEPSRLKEELEALREFMVPECEIYLYCSCVREATSVRIAHELGKENCATQVIVGGLRAWLKAGGEVETVPAGDVKHLPRWE